MFKVILYLLKQRHCHGQILNVCLTSQVFKAPNKMQIMSRSMSFNTLFVNVICHWVIVVTEIWDPNITSLCRKIDIWTIKYMAQSRCQNICVIAPWEYWDLFRQHFILWVFATNYREIIKESLNFSKSSSIDNLWINWKCTNWTLPLIFL